MRHLNIAITAGRHTCRDGSGPLCPFARVTPFGFTCCIFRSPLPLVTKAGEPAKRRRNAWLGRLPECKAAEQGPDGKVNVAGLAELDVLRPLIVPPAEPQGHAGDRSDMSRRLAKALRKQGAKARAVHSGVRVTFPMRDEP